ncbi:MATE family efflux transporter [Maledivibacter halophilus]|uniref:Putative efflux protein, MATE family n=1 Tax=Maledivibacter halophilus TaxID=36842 RepID=A0A1T5LM20_9FIRM|nr:MATE family efflux transporter [Maledivibacter halophilus]SKC76528.1 putative efflux protein, MATE family [Maledivibacter halophilus]
MLKGLFKDKKFYNTMIAITLPIALQNLITSSLNMMDTVMIGRVGEENIAAVGMANQYFFLFALLLFGINSGAAIFIAQFWGKKDIKNIRRILGIGILLGGIVAVLFTFGALAFPRLIMRVFTKDINVIILGTKYLRIVSFSYIITAISFAFSIASRSIGQAKLPMIVSGISLIANTVLNYILIFGNFGAPTLGIVGAAIATLIARIIELLFLLKIIYKNRGPLAGKINKFIDINRAYLKKFFNTALPVILNELFWSLGITMYSVAYGRIGTGAFAAVQIANTVQNVFMVIARGMGSACAVMIGNELGANNEKRAIEYAKRFSILGLIIGLAIGAVLYISAPFVLYLFGVEAEVYTNAYKILGVMALFMTFKVFTGILIVGILRSGGDTKFSLLLEGGSVWFVGVPLAFIGALILELPIYWVVALVSLEEIVKSLIGIPRIISKKWVRNVVDQM